MRTENTLILTLVGMIALCTAGSINLELNNTGWGVTCLTIGLSPVALGLVWLIIQIGLEVYKHFENENRALIARSVTINSAPTITTQVAVSSLKPLETDL